MLAPPCYHKWTSKWRNLYLHLTARSSWVQGEKDCFWLAFTWGSLNWICLFNTEKNLEPIFRCSLSLNFKFEFWWEEVPLHWKRGGDERADILCGCDITCDTNFPQSFIHFPNSAIPQHNSEMTAISFSQSWQTYGQPLCFLLSFPLTNEFSWSLPHMVRMSKFPSWCFHRSVTIWRRKFGLSSEELPGLLQDISQSSHTGT